MLVGQDAVELHVEPTDHRGLGDAEGGVGPVAGGELRRVDPEHAREPLPEQCRAGPGRWHGDEVDPLPVDRGRPAVEHVGDLLDPPEPLRHLRAAVLRAQVVQEAPVGPGAPVLDVLLPLGRDLTHEVTRRVHEVQLGVALLERLQRPRHLHPRGGPEDLVADDRGARPVPDLRRQPVPGAGGLALEPTPGQVHQVERRQEVCVLAVGGIQDAARAQLLAVGEQDVLDERRPGLGGTHVQQNASGHPVHLGPSCRCQARRQAARASSSVRSRSMVPGCWCSLGASTSGSPCTA